MKIRNGPAYPVLAIHVLIRVPFSGEKWPLPADDLSREERGQGRVFLRARANAKSTNIVVLFAVAQPTPIHAVFVFFSSL